ncbi:MAG: hypothetical protein K2G00_02795 [Duncaniella sp.]|nr:hypothetical protein [Duncaniella sp.]
MKPFLRPICTMILTAILTACSQGDGTPATTYPDRNRFEVIGIDISAHNGDIDFRKVAADGISFVIIKATEGGHSRTASSSTISARRVRRVSKSAHITFSASIHPAICRDSTSSIRSSHVSLISRSSSTSRSGPIPTVSPHRWCSTA